MATYLLTWNPRKYQWDDLQEEVEKVRSETPYITRWSCGATKRIVPGDRVFLMRLGVAPKGIVASGTVTRGVFEAEHWLHNSGVANYIEFQVDTLLNPEEEEILSDRMLSKGELSNIDWFPQSSGIQISEEASEILERLWNAFLIGKKGIYPDEISSTQSLYEGAMQRVTVNAYERNEEARKRCIQHYGTGCSVCGLDFEEIYGEIGREFIHVHHLLPISLIGRQYEIDPVSHLRPVCPNCHAMLHRKDPPYSIGELKEIMAHHTSLFE